MTHNNKELLVNVYCENDDDDNDNVCIATVYPGRAATCSSTPAGARALMVYISCFWLSYVVRPEGGGEGFSGDEKVGEEGGEEVGREM